MKAELREHYEARLTRSADDYERDPCAASAWALVRALSLARMHNVTDLMIESVMAAVAPYEAEILEAALEYAVEENYAQQCEDYAVRADYSVDLWEEQAPNFLILFFELQAAHDWMAGRILPSEILVGQLVGKLDQYGTAVSELASTIARHAWLFEVGRSLYQDLVANADRQLLTAAYDLRLGWDEVEQLTAGQAAEKRPNRTDMQTGLTLLFRRAMEEQKQLRIAAAADTSAGPASAALANARFVVTGDPTVQLAVRLSKSAGEEFDLIVGVIPDDVPYQAVEVRFEDDTTSLVQLTAGLGRQRFPGARFSQIVSLAVVTKDGRRLSVERQDLP